MLTKRIFFLLMMFLSFNAISQTSSEPQIILTPKDTSICLGSTIKLRAELSHDHPIGIDPTDPEAGEPGGNKGTVTLTDDAFSAVVNIGFTFNFYGVDYTQAIISSNNYLSFDLTSASGYSGWSIASAAPSTNTPPKAIMCPWQDINPASGGTISYQTVGEAPNRVFILEYCNIPMFSCTGLLFSDQIKLFENSNVIETHIIARPYCDWNGGYAIHGVSRDATLAHIVPGRNYPTVWTTENDGYRFTPDATNVNNYILEPIPFSPFLMNVTNDDIEWFAEGDEVTVIGTGDEITVTPDGVITYYVAKITSNTSCVGISRTDTVFIDYNAVANKTLNIEICQGETYNFYGRELYQSGTYEHTVIIPAGCDTFVTLILKQNPLPEVELDQYVFAICEGDNVNINVTQPSSNNTYQWYYNDNWLSGATSSLLATEQTGEYYVVAKTNKGCEARSAKVVVDFNPNPVAEISTRKFDDLCIGDTIKLAAANHGDGNYYWTPESYFRYTTGATGIEVVGVLEGNDNIIALEVINEFGCKDADSIYIRAVACCEIVVPTAFTPNGDGNNDYFAPKLQSGQQIITLQVFDRRGMMVYDNQNIKTGWNGTMKNQGKLLSNDVYFYRLIYSCTDGEYLEKKGDITLIN